VFRVLVVDDHAVFRDSVCTVLRNRFPWIELEEAGDGPRALRMVGRCAPDMVLLDVRLPGGNGIELTKTIRGMCPSVTAVILTGYNLPQYREAAFRNGADCFLYKGSVSCMNDVVARVEGAIRAGKAGH